MLAPSPSVTFINKLPSPSFQMWWGRRRRGEEEGGRLAVVQVAVPSATLCPAQLALEPQFLGVLAPGVQGLPQIWSQSQETCDHPSCPEKLGSRFSYLRFIDRNLCSPEGDLGKWQCPILMVPPHPVWAPASGPSRLLETPKGQSHPAMSTAAFMGAECLDWGPVWRGRLSLLSEKPGLTT